MYKIFRGSTKCCTNSNRSALCVCVCCAAVRSGDYYLFEDLGEKIELDLMTAKAPAVVSDLQLRQRLASKQTVEQVREIDFVDEMSVCGIFFISLC